MVAQQLERALLVDGVALHEDPLGSLDHGAPAEGAFEALELGEAAKDACECDDPACGGIVSLTRHEYESVPASPTRFLVVADHEDPQVEHLVADNARFAIVETLPGTSSRIALRSDPQAAR